MTTKAEIERVQRILRRNIKKATHPAVSRWLSRNAALISFLCWNGTPDKGWVPQPLHSSRLVKIIKARRRYRKAMWISLILLAFVLVGIALKQERKVKPVKVISYNDRIEHITPCGAPDDRR